MDAGFHFSHLLDNQILDKVWTSWFPRNSPMSSPESSKRNDVGKKSCQKSSDKRLAQLEADRKEIGTGFSTLSCVKQIDRI